MQRPPSIRSGALETAASAILLSLLVGLLAIPPAGAQEEAWKMVFEGATEVNVVNVEVVVTDRQGRPVTGLAREDFELRENGEPVEISNFYAVEGGNVTTSEAPRAAGEPPAPQPEAQPMQLVVYVDGGNLSEINRSKVLARLREFLLERWRPGLRAMLVSNDGPAVGGGSVTIRQGFTSVPHDFFVALDKLAGETSASPRLDVDRESLMRQIEDINVERAAGADLFGLEQTPELKAEIDTLNAEARGILPQIELYAEQALGHAHRTLGVLDRFVEAVAGMPGRKAILYVSDGLDLRPSEAIYEAYARRFEILADVGPKVSPQMEANRFDASRELQALAARANANRVTFYTLDASPPASTRRGSAATTAGAGGNFGSWADSYESTRQRNLQEPLTAMAVETGGRVGLTLSSLQSTMEGVLDDLDNHYSLGYVADRIEGERKIEVAVRGRKDVEVRHRSALRDKTVAQRAAERAQAALLVDDLAGDAVDDNPLGVGLEAREQQPQDDGNFVVPVLVKIPLGRLVLMPGETVHQGQVSMFVAVRDDQGRMSGVNQHMCPIRIPNDEVLTALGRSAACGVRLLMRGGPQKIAVSVLDETASILSTVRLDLDVGAAAPVTAEPAALR